MVSPRKSASSVNLTADEYGSNGAVNKLTPKSSESLYSAPSSRVSASLIYRRKVPAHFGNRQPALIPATTEVQQRVISARRLRFKNVQNQLGLAQHKITELSNELRVLRTLHKRQNSALAKYESTNAELPRLLHSHAEELRVWQTKYRTLQASHKELEQKLKQKESQILALGDENRYYSQLNKDKNLEDRQRLADKLQSLELRLQEKENQMKIGERRSHLEIKNLKQQLMNEQKKLKDVFQKLEKTKLELSNYQKLEELNIAEKLSNMCIKQTNTRTELKSNSRRTPKDKPFGGSIMNASKTPSPALDNPGGGGDGGVEDDDSDFPISHRSLKSTTSSINVDFSTTRTVRKLSLHVGKNHCKDTVSISNASMTEIIGDGPDQKQKSDIIEKKMISRKPMKMMVNMPNFDNGADGDTSLAAEDDADVILGGEQIDEKDLNNGIDYNYTDDFDENNDDDDNDVEQENQNHFLNDSTANDDMGVLKSDDEDTNLGEIDYENNEINEPISQTKENIKNIRKQITDDYKEREAFLDTFCRQATSSGQRNKKELNSKVGGKSIQSSSRKHKLLAALKAIDDDQCSSQD